MGVVTAGEYQKKSRAKKVADIDVNTESSTGEAPAVTVPEPEPINEAKAVSDRVKAASRVVFILDSAPIGRSRCAFYHEGVERSIDLVNRKYIVPLETPQVEIDAMTAMLIPVGFKRTAEVEGLDALLEEQRIAFEKDAEIQKKKKIVWTVAKGDVKSAGGTAIGADSKMAFYLEGKEVQVEFKNGLCTTEDPAIHEFLLKSGCWDYAVEENPQGA